MLREFWNIVRINFKKRFILYYLIVWTMTLFVTLPILVVKFVAFAIFVAASVLFVPIFTSQIISQVSMILAFKGREKFPVFSEISDLARRIGVYVKEVGIVRGRNAFVFMGIVVLGKELLDRLTFDERQAVVAHELGHIKEKHGLFRAILPIPLLAVPFYAWSRLSSPIFFSEWLTQAILIAMLNIALLAFVMLVVIPLNWYLEVRADRIAARFMGKENIKSALLKLVNKKDLKEASETHPSVAQRIKLIDELDF